MHSPRQFTSCIDRHSASQPRTQSVTPWRRMRSPSPAPGKKHDSGKPGMAVSTYRMKVNLEASRWLSLTARLGPAIKEGRKRPSPPPTPQGTNCPYLLIKQVFGAIWGMQSKYSLEWLSVRAVAITEALQAPGGRPKNYVLPVCDCE